MTKKIDSYYLLRSINSYKNSQEEGLIYFENCIKYVLVCLKINLEDEMELNNTFEAFIQKSKERIKRYKIENTNVAIKACFHERHGIVLSTIHGVKRRRIYNGNCVWFIKWIFATFGIISIKVKKR